MIPSATGGGIVETLSDTLSKRVQELLSAEHEPILSTTGTRAAIDSLAARTQSLETAVRELSEVVSALAASQPRR
jgi:hypothetical protein